MEELMRVLKDLEDSFESLAKMEAENAADWKQMNIDFRKANEA